MYQDPEELIPTSRGLHATSTTPNWYIPPPPPPPAPKFRFWLLALVGLIIFMGGGITEYTLMREKNIIRHAFQPQQQGTSSSSSHPPSTPTQAMNSNYTADDILKAMQNADCSCGAELSRNVSLEDFIGPNFSTTVQPTSQDAWSDPVQQFYNVGLWVYADAATALSIYEQIGTYEDSSGISITPLKIDHVHRRCLFLISGGTWGTPWSDYQQVIDQTCV